MTDALTGLGNRRQLTADLAARAGDLQESRPLNLSLFDLDGFKQYNDTFGHQAGDQLLSRLGANLSQLVAGFGTAYRMGGDEFCTLWNTCDANIAGVEVGDAATALSEEGAAFSIRCSYGTVDLPAETADIEEALRLADSRMYVRKERRRTPGGRRSTDILRHALAEREPALLVDVGRG
jgi:diguanylate cyclase (GGDEF)-like protein